MGSTLATYTDSSSLSSTTTSDSDDTENPVEDQYENNTLDPPDPTTTTKEDFKKHVNYEAFSLCVQNVFRVKELKEALKLLPVAVRGWSGFRKNELIALLLREAEKLLELVYDHPRKPVSVLQAKIFFEGVANVSAGLGRNGYQYNIGERGRTQILREIEISSNLKRKGVWPMMIQNKRLKIELNPEVPSCIDLVTCTDPFLYAHPAYLKPLKTLFLNLDSENTSTEFIIPVMEKDDRVCLRCFFLPESPQIVCDGNPDSGIVSYTSEQSEIPGNTMKNPSESQVSPPAEIKWPNSCHFHVNGNHVDLLGNEVVDLTRHFIPGLNRLQFCHERIYSSRPCFFVAVLLMKAVGWESVIPKVIKITKDDAMSFARKSFNSDGELLEISHKVSLVDVVGQGLIKVPCRSFGCTHLTVFDLNIFLQMNFNNRKWSCPICYKPCQLLDLYIDEYFQSILSEIPEDVTEVSIMPDASYVVTPPEKQHSSCSEDDGDEAVGTWTGGMTADSRVQIWNTSNFVDLTLDD